MIGAAATILAAIAATGGIAIGGAIIGAGIFAGIKIVELLHLSDPPVVDSIRMNYPEKE